MSHAISGLLASPEHLGVVSQRVENCDVARLTDGWGFTPLIDSDLDRLLGVPQKFLGGDFVYVSKELVEWVCSITPGISVAYVETDYFGGMGTQAAFASAKGKICFEPESGRDSINHALAAIGVDYEKSGLDEFETVGLHLIRSNDDAKEIARRSD